MCVAKLRFVGTLMFSNHRNGARWKMWSMPSVDSAQCGVWKMWRAENAERVVDH